MCIAFACKSYDREFQKSFSSQYTMLHELSHSTTRTKEVHAARGSRWDYTEYAGCAVVAFGK